MDFYKELCSVAGKENVAVDEQMSRHTTFRIGGPADYFVSIHANANTDPAINGTEVYVYRKYTQSYYLAQHILNAVVNIVGTKDNGVRANPSLYVLRRTNMPAVLVELAYLTNAGDAGKLETMQSEFARGIYEGMLSYFGMDQ